MDKPTKKQIERAGAHHEECHRLSSLPTPDTNPIDGDKLIEATRPTEKPIKVLSKDKLEDKYCTAREVDCDGDILSPMTTEQIKECFLERCEHNDLFEQILDHEIERIQKTINESEFGGAEMMVNAGAIASLNYLKKVYWNIHNVTDSINNKTEEK